MTTIEEFTQWFGTMWDLIYSHQLKKAENKLSIGKVSMYWAGTIIRIDIKVGG